MKNRTEQLAKINMRKATRPTHNEQRIKHRERSILEHANILCTIILTDGAECRGRLPPYRNCTVANQLYTAGFGVIGLLGKF